MRSGARVEMAVEKRTDPLNATEVRLRSGTSVWGACSDDVNGQASPDRHVHGRIELAIPVPTNLGDPGMAAGHASLASKPVEVSALIDEAAKATAALSTNSGGAVT